VNLPEAVVSFSNKFWEMPMRVFDTKILAAVAVIALLAGSAFAQNAVPRYGDVDKDKSPQQIRAEKDAERAYNKSLQNIPEQKSTDPWGAVRSDNAPKTAAKPAPAKPKPKSDSAAK
jgi:hypothetical protein